MKEKNVVSDRLEQTISSVYIFTKTMIGMGKYLKKKMYLNKVSWDAWKILV
jgi:hypothetical protein